MSDRDQMDNLTGDNNSATNVLEAEKAVLSLCMRHREALEASVMKRIVAEDFSDPRHVTIFKAISELYLEGNQANRITVCDKLQSTGKTKQAGGDEYVFDIANIHVVLSAGDSYIDVVIKNSLNRKLLSTLDELHDKAVNHKGTVKDIVDTGISKLNLLKVDEDNQGFESIGSIARRNLVELREAMKGGETKTVKTGFSYLDNITGGFKPGTMNIIAARPGMGKTALMLNIATNVATMYSKTVAIFSLEMSKSEIVNRILAAQSRTDFKKIERAEVSPEDLAELESTLKRITLLPIYIDEKTGTNPIDIRAKCKDLENTAPNGVGLVIIDYLQLMTYPDKASGSRQNEIAAISRDIKVLAKELSVPVIALSQLNRGTENREDGDHTPGLADIRDSGAIEQDADCVIFIHRPEYYNKKKEGSTGDKPKIEDAQLIVAKNRHGETSTAYVKWYGAKTTFFEQPRRDDPKDPMENAYNRTTTSDRASGDYKFDEAEEPPFPSEDDAPADMGYEEEAPDFSENEDFFSSDTHDDLPEGF